MQGLLGGVRCAAVRSVGRRAPLRPSFHSARIIARQDPRRPKTQGELFAELLRQGAEEQLKKERTQQQQYGYQPVSRIPRQQAYEAYPAQNTASQGQRTAQAHPRLVLIVIVAGGAGVYYVFNLHKVPSTGRWRFMDVGIPEELRMGHQAYEETMRQYQGQLLSPSAPDSVRVRRVANRIIQACKELDAERAPHAPPTQWSVHVIRDPQQNAFALPGGSIFVFTGILPVCEDDDGLATVMAHEIAHQLARHSAEKMSGYKVVMALGFLLDVMGFDMGLSRIALNLLMSLPNSRKMESEADFLGLRIMSQACYNPDKAVNFWRRMNKGEEHGGIAESAQGLLSTHPVNSQRIEHIKEWVCRETHDSCPRPSNCIDRAGVATPRRLPPPCRGSVASTAHRGASAPSGARAPRAARGAAAIPR